MQADSNIQWPYTQERPLGGDSLLYLKQQGTKTDLPCKGRMLLTVI